MLNILKLFAAPLASNPKTVDIVGKCAIGATGAVGTHTGKGVTVTRTNTGLYTLTFATGAIPACLNAEVHVVDNTDNTHYRVKVKTQGTTTVTIAVLVDGDASADDVADPPNGSYLSWRICVLNTSATR